MKGYSNTVSKKWLHNPGRLLVIVMAAGFLLRLGVAVHSGSHIGWEDEQDYLNLAQSIAQGNGFVDTQGVPTAFRAPGYPAFLALGVVTGIKSVLGFKVLNVLLGTLMIWLVYILGKTLVDVKTGLIAATLSAIYPYYLYMPSVVLATTLFTAMLLTATLLAHISVKDERPIVWLICGVSFGILTLIRPSGAVILAAVLIWMVLFIRPLPKKWSRIAVIMFAVMLVVIPWMARNSAQIGAFSISTNGYRNLWLGNNEHATMNTGSDIEMPAEMQSAIDAVTTETGKERIYRLRALQYIQAEPGRFVVLTAAKAAGFWRLTPSPSTETDADSNTLVNLASLFTVGPLFVLAIAGYIFSGADVRSQFNLWILYAVFFTLLHAVFISKVRFRLPIDALLMVCAAYAIDKFRNRIVQRNV